MYGYGWAAAAGGSTTSSNRKGAPPRLRPVNIVQHEDAGPPEDAEMIELPPAYTMVGKGATSTAATTVTCN